MGLGSKNEVCYQEYVYDFSVDGGAVGSINLTAKNGYDPIDVGSVVKSVTYKQLVAFASGGAATVALGDQASATRYKAATAFNDSTYNANAVAAGSGVPAHVTAANIGQVSLTIATAALTAGKMLVMVEFYKPTL